MPNNRKSNVTNLNAYKASKGINAIEPKILIKINPRIDESWEYASDLNDRGSNVNVTIQKETIWDLYLSYGKLPFRVKHHTSGAIYIVDDVNFKLNGFIVAPVNIKAKGYYSALDQSKIIYIEFDSTAFVLI